MIIYDYVYFFSEHLQDIISPPGRDIHWNATTLSSRRCCGEWALYRFSGFVVNKPMDAFNRSIILTSRWTTGFGLIQLDGSK